MKVKNFIIAVLCIGLLVCIALYLRQKLNLTYFGSVKRSEVLIYNEVYDNTFDLINIDNEGYADITIKESDESNVSVKVYAEKNNIEYDKSDSELKIKSKSKTCVIFCDVETTVIEITLPRYYDGNISINSEVGSVSLGEFDNANMNITADTGDIKVASAKDLKIDSDAGIIYVNKVNGKLEIDNDMGNIDVDNLYVTENSYIKADVGNINILRTSEVKIVTKNGSKLNHVNKKYEDSNITLTLSTDVGEINVNN